MTQMFDLSGRVAVVSGAASGMGRAMSLALGEAGRGPDARRHQCGGRGKNRR